MLEIPVITIVLLVLTALVALILFLSAIYQSNTPFLSSDLAVHHKHNQSVFRWNVFLGILAAILCIAAVISVYVF